MDLADFQSVGIERLAKRGNGALVWANSRPVQLAKAW